jgi:hypothetical protein
MASNAVSVVMVSPSELVAVLSALPIQKMYNNSREVETFKRDRLLANTPAKPYAARVTEK